MCAKSGVFLKKQAKMDSYGLEYCFIGLGLPNPLSFTNNATLVQNSRVVPRGESRYGKYLANPYRYEVHYNYGVDKVKPGTLYI
jgi:hypothetical protein